MIVAVDAMGGDYAPREIVRGAVDASREGLADIILVGNRERLETELQLLHPPDNLKILHTGQMITMDENPAAAIRRKREASIIVATRLVKQGQAAAVVSAGNTGAQMAAAILILGRSGKIDRPAIATVLPSVKGPVVLLDIGANVDCQPENLYEFALMGSLYATRVMGIKNPRVGLLNNGTEAGKGNKTTQRAYSLLQSAPLNFVGNVEGRDVFKGELDVIVCDGFVGNIILKFGEGMAQVLYSMLGKELKNSFRFRLGAKLLLPALQKFKDQIDYNEYGGAPLLGVQGISIVCHGNSNASTIKNAIKVAGRCVRQGLIAALEQLDNVDGKEGKVF